MTIVEQLVATMILDLALAYDAEPYEVRIEAARCLIGLGPTGEGAARSLMRRGHGDWRGRAPMCFDGRKEKA